MQALAYLFYRLRHFIGLAKHFSHRNDVEVFRCVHWHNAGLQSMLYFLELAFLRHFSCFDEVLLPDLVVAHIKRAIHFVLIDVIELLRIRCFFFSVHLCGLLYQEFLFLCILEPIEPQRTRCILHEVIPWLGTQWHDELGIIDGHQGQLELVRICRAVLLMGVLVLYFRAEFVVDAVGVAALGQGY